MTGVCETSVKFLGLTEFVEKEAAAAIGAPPPAPGSYFVSPAAFASIDLVECGWGSGFETDCATLEAQ